MRAIFCFCAAQLDAASCSLRDFREFTGTVVRTWRACPMFYDGDFAESAASNREIRRRRRLRRGRPTAIGKQWIIGRIVRFPSAEHTKRGGMRWT